MNRAAVISCVNDAYLHIYLFIYVFIYLRIYVISSDMSVIVFPLTHLNISLSATYLHISDIS